VLDTQTCLKQVGCTVHCGKSLWFGTQVL